MLLFPLYTDLKNKLVIVVGGGDVAQRKIQLMLKANARIRAVSLHFNETLETLGQDQKIELIRQSFDPVLLDDAWFVIAATSSSEVNSHVARHAHARKLFVNVVDDPVLSSVHIPAIVDRSPLVVSISSSGAAPMIARQIREQIEALVDDSVGRLTALTQTYRNQIRKHRPCMANRRQFYEWLMRGPVMQHVRAGNDDAAAQCLQSELSKNNDRTSGHTIQINIESDDPGDITLNTLRALSQADIIFYDERIDPAILDMARRDADLHSYKAAIQASRLNLPNSVIRQLSQHTRKGNIAVVLTRISICSVLPRSDTRRTNQNHTLPSGVQVHQPAGVPVIS